MPHWEAELKTLLASLGVSLEADSAEPDLSSTPKSVQFGHKDDGLAEFEDDHFTLVNREIEATVREVARVSRSGLLDQALRNDVIFVLRALTRDTGSTGIDAESWHLDSAAAVLHFCRIVQRLTRALSQPDCG